MRFSYYRSLSDILQAACKHKAPILMVKLEAEQQPDAPMAAPGEVPAIAPAGQGVDKLKRDFTEVTVTTGKKEHSLTGTKDEVTLAAAASMLTPV